MTQLAHGKDTVPKTCVSSKVLIFVMKSKTMKLTMEQKSEIISEMASFEVSSEISPLS